VIKLAPLRTRCLALLPCLRRYGTSWSCTFKSGLNMCPILWSFEHRKFCFQTLHNILLQITAHVWRDISSRWTRLKPKLILGPQNFSTYMRILLTFGKRHTSTGGPVKGQPGPGPCLAWEKKSKTKPYGLTIEGIKMVSFYVSRAAVCFCFSQKLCFLLFSFVSKVQHFPLPLVTYG
jgi:hypothetical protein